MRLENYDSLLFDYIITNKNFIFYFNEDEYNKDVYGFYLNIYLISAVSYEKQSTKIKF